MYRGFKVQVAEPENVEDAVITVSYKELCYVKTFTEQWCKEELHRQLERNRALLVQMSRLYDPDGPTHAARFLAACYRRYGDRFRVPVLQGRKLAISQARPLKEYFPEILVELRFFGIKPEDVK